VTNLFWKYIHEKLPTNFWKPLIPSRYLVSVTPSPFSWLPSIDITQPYGQNSFSDDWVPAEHFKDAEETDILVAVADDKPAVKDAVKEMTTDNSSAYQTRLRPIRKHQYFRQILPFIPPFHRRMGKYPGLDRKVGLRLVEWNSPVVDRLLEVRCMDMTCTVVIISILGLDTSLHYYTCYMYSVLSVQWIWWEREEEEAEEEEEDGAERGGDVDGQSSSKDGRYYS
jgi:hypothetical protein